MLEIKSNNATEVKDGKKKEAIPDNSQSIVQSRRVMKSQTNPKVKKENKKNLLVQMSWSSDSDKNQENLDDAWGNLDELIIPTSKVTVQDDINQFDQSHIPKKNQKERIETQRLQQHDQDSSQPKKMKNVIEKSTNLPQKHYEHQKKKSKYFTYCTPEG